MLCRHDSLCVFVCHHDKLSLWQVFTCLCITTVQVWGPSSGRTRGWTQGRKHLHLWSSLVTSENCLYCNNPYWVLGVSTSPWWQIFSSSSVVDFPKPWHWRWLLCKNEEHPGFIWVINCGHIYPQTQKKQESLIQNNLEHISQIIYRVYYYRQSTKSCCFYGYLLINFWKMIPL